MLDKLKSIFVKEDDVEIVTPKVPQATSPTPVRTLTGKNYNDYLNKVMDKANLPGPDFHEFTKTLEGYEGQPIGEQAKYQLAFGAFKSMGVTPEKLVETGNFYIQQVEKENQDYQVEYARELQGIEAKKREAAQLAEKNVKLTSEIQSNNLKIQQLNEAIFATQGQIASDKASFENTVENTKAIIMDRITKIKTYLNNASTTNQS